MAEHHTTEALQRLAEGIHDGPMQALYAAGLALQLAEHLPPGTPEGAEAIVDARHHIQEVVDELRGLLRALRAENVASGLTAVSRAVGTPVVTDISDEALADLAEVDGVELVVAASTAVAAARRRSGDPLALRLVKDDHDVVLELAGPGVAGGDAVASLERHAKRLGGTVTLPLAAPAPTVQLRIPA